MVKQYNVYRGLQRPLTFKGFKGKYIYQAAGLILASLAIAGIASSLIDTTVAAAIFAIVLVGGMFHISQKQKKGLYTKKSETGHFIVPARTRNPILRYDEKETTRYTVYRH